MLVRHRTGSTSAPHGHYWENPGDVVEVPDDLGNELLRISAEFEEVLPEAGKSIEDFVAGGPVPASGEDEESTEDVGPAEDADGDGVPDGTANQILAWVNNEPERAAAALEAERAKAEPRTSLIAKLEKLAS